MLTNLEGLRQYLNLDDSDTQNDDLMYDLIKSVSKRVNQRMNRNLEAQDYQNAKAEYQRGDGTNRILVYQYPVNAVFSIYDDVDRVFDITTLEDQTSIVESWTTPGLIQLKGNIFINSSWWSYYNLENLKLSYNAGFVCPWDNNAVGNPNGYTNILPEDVIMAVNKLCAVEMMRSKNLFATVKQDRDPAALETQAWADLDPYRKIR